MRFVGSVIDSASENIEHASVDVLTGVVHEPLVHDFRVLTDKVRYSGVAQAEEIPCHTRPHPGDFLKSLLGGCIVHGRLCGFSGVHFVQNFLAAKVEDLLGEAHADFPGVVHVAFGFQADGTGAVHVGHEAGQPDLVATDD